MKTSTKSAASKTAKSKTKTKTKSAASKSSKSATKKPKPKPKSTAAKSTSTAASKSKPKTATTKSTSKATKSTSAKKSTASTKSTSAKKSTASKKSTSSSPRSKATTEVARPGKTTTEFKRPKGGKIDWVRFVADHGVVLASARGPVPNLAESIAGEPIVGSWWAHPKSHEIFDTLSAIDDSPDVKCFKLVEGKVTYVHRRVWPHLVRLVRDSVIPLERAAAVTQEHTESGEHHNIITQFPDWVPEDVGAAADALSATEAREAFATWLE